MAILNGTRDRNVDSTPYAFYVEPPKLTAAQKKAKEKEAKENGGKVEAEPERFTVYGIIANVRVNTQASALSLDDWNALLASGRVRMELFEPKERDFSEFRSAIGL